MKMRDNRALMAKNYLQGDPAYFNKNSHFSVLLFAYVDFLLYLCTRKGFLLMFN